jgi:DNA invertase Pin-like site-specific DNA recombinase
MFIRTFGHEPETCPGAWLAALSASTCSASKPRSALAPGPGEKELATTLDFIRAGDVLVVTRIDRLARSIGDLQDIVRTLKAKGADLKATEQPINTATAAGKAFLDMLGVFAEFETNLRKERQLEGIAKAKGAGVYRGGKRRIDRETVRAMFVAGQGPAAIAKALRCSRMQVYRVLGEGTSSGA